MAAEVRRRPEHSQATAPGFGASYKPFEWVRLMHPVPYLFRGWYSFWDALHEWASDSYSKVAEDGTSLRHLHERVPIKKRFTTQIGDSLGAWRDDYVAAKTELKKIVAEAKREHGLSVDSPIPDDRAKEPFLGAVLELERWVWPLLLAKENPRRFFAEDAPLMFPGAFDTANPQFRLAGTLQQWGIASLLNEDVRGVFEDAVQRSPAELLRLIAQVDFADAYFEGKRGKDKRPRERQVDNAATKAAVRFATRRIQEKQPFHRRPTTEAMEVVAKAGGTKADKRRRKLTPAAIKRRIARLPKKRSR
jgi:hypothetical protein